jgi:hypothetical protein
MWSADAGEIELANHSLPAQAAGQGSRPGQFGAKMGRGLGRAACPCFLAGAPHSAPGCFAKLEAVRPLDHCLELSMGRRWKVPLHFPRGEEGSRVNRQSASPNTVVALSGGAFLALLWSVLLDWRFVLGEWNLATSQIGLAALIYVAIFGGWILALLATSKGSKRPLIVLLVYSILLCAYALLDLVVYCPTTCPTIWLYYVANWANLTFGLLATGAAILQLAQPSPP